MLLGARVRLLYSHQRLASEATTILLLERPVTTAQMEGQKAAGRARPAAVFPAGCPALSRLLYPVVLPCRATHTFLIPELCNLAAPGPVHRRCSVGSMNTIPLSTS